MKTERVEYEADGLQMIGHLAWAASEPRPAVLVFPDAGGLGEHAKARAERLASEFGYAALACDLHGQQEVIRDFNAVLPRLQTIRTSAAKVRARTVEPCGSNQAHSIYGILTSTSSQSTMMPGIAAICVFPLRSRMLARP